jgi:hypothetical protein
VFVQVDGDIWPGWTLATMPAGGGAATPAVGGANITGTHPRWQPGANG